MDHFMSFQRTTKTSLTILAGMRLSISWSLSPLLIVLQQYWSMAFHLNEFWMFLDNIDKVILRSKNYITNLAGTNIFSSVNHLFPTMHTVMIFNFLFWYITLCTLVTLNGFFSACSHILWVNFLAVSMFRCCWDGGGCCF